MAEKVSIGIVGGTGYTGLELCRLLECHSLVKITDLFSKAAAGKSVGELYPHLLSLKDIIYQAFDPMAIPTHLDVLFLAMPHGESHAFMPDLLKLAQIHQIKIVDLSADFRLSEVSQFETYYQLTHKSPELLNEIVYGLPEKYRKEIRSSLCVATPGCYATAVILGLLPLSLKGYLSKTIIVDAKSGVSGAGKGLKPNLMFCESNEHFSAYNTGVHRHIPEMEAEVGVKVFFSPHLVPMSRGILVTMYVRNESNLSQAEVDEVFESATKDEPFLHYQGQKYPSTQWVTGSNNCQISSIVKGEYIVVFSCIDNIVKGSGGQAVQCMNLMMGWEETLGLQGLVPFYL